MNISSIIEETANGAKRKASLVDLRWLQDGIVNPGHPSFSPDGPVGKQDKNCKPELELQWGYGDIFPSLSAPEIGTVQRNIDPADCGDASPVIILARDLMNRGMSGNKIVAALRHKFTAADLMKSRVALRKQFALEGIVGCIAIDARGYKDCNQAMKIASKSPFKKFQKYVIGCDCGTPHMVEDNREAEFKISSSTGNATDDFMAADNSKHERTMRAHCHSTMLPIVAFQGDLDPSELNQTFIDVQNITPLTGLAPEKVSKIKASSASPLRKIQALFRAILSADEKREATQYQSKVNTSDLVVDTEDQPIDLDAPLKTVVENMNVIGRMDIEFDIDKHTDSPEIDMSQNLDPEFVGFDDVAIDNPVEIKGEFKISTHKDDDLQDMDLTD